MKTGTKGTLILVATFAIGIVVGALLEATLARDRIERLRGFRGARQFAPRIEQILQPRDEEQARAIREVLDRAAERNAEIFRRARDDMQSLIDSLRAELEPLLDEQQLQRLDRLGRGPKEQPFEGEPPRRRPGGRPLPRDQPPF
jgi:hypothetical protein